jgi:hypothetical protein
LSGMSNQIVLSPRYCSFEQIAHSCKGSVLQVDCLVQASVLRQNELSSLGRPEFQMVLPGLCGQALERALKKADKLGLYARPASLRMGTSVAVLNLLLRQELLAAPYCVAASTRGGKRIAIAPTTSGGVRVSMARPEVSHPFLMVLSNRR